MQLPTTPLGKLSMPPISVASTSATSSPSISPSVPNKDTRKRKTSSGQGEFDSERSGDYSPSSKRGYRPGPARRACTACRKMKRSCVESTANPEVCVRCQRQCLQNRCDMFKTTSPMQQEPLKLGTAASVMPANDDFRHDFTIHDPSGFNTAISLLAALIERCPPKAAQYTRAIVQSFAKDSCLVHSPRLQCNSLHASIDGECQGSQEELDPEASLCDYLSLEGLAEQHLQPKCATQAESSYSHCNLHHLPALVPERQLDNRKAQTIDVLPPPHPVAPLPLGNFGSETSNQPDNPICSGSFDVSQWDLNYGFNVPVDNDSDSGAQSDVQSAESMLTSSKFTDARQINGKLPDLLAFESSLGLHLDEFPHMQQSPFSLLQALKPASTVSQVGMDPVEPSSFATGTSSFNTHSSGANLAHQTLSIAPYDVTLFDFPTFYQPSSQYFDPITLTPEVDWRHQPFPDLYSPQEALAGVIFDVSTAAPPTQQVGCHQTEPFNAFPWGPPLPTDQVPAQQIDWVHASTPNSTPFSSWALPCSDENQNQFYSDQELLEFFS